MSIFCDRTLAGYAGAGPVVQFVRVGTLDRPGTIAARHLHGIEEAWMVLPEGTTAVVEYDDASDHWPAESLVRRAAVLARDAKT